MSVDRNGNLHRLDAAIVAAGIRLNQQFGTLLAMDEESEKTRSAERQVAITALELERLRVHREQLLLNPEVEV